MRCALVTVVQTCALPILLWLGTFLNSFKPGSSNRHSLFNAAIHVLCKEICVRALLFVLSLAVPVGLFVRIVFHSAFFAFLLPFFSLFGFLSVWCRHRIRLTFLGSLHSFRVIASNKIGRASCRERVCQ